LVFVHHRARGSGFLFRAEAEDSEFPTLCSVPNFGIPVFGVLKDGDKTIITQSKNYLDAYIF
jgi:hypothetical protein